MKTIEDTVVFDDVSPCTYVEMVMVLHDGVRKSEQILSSSPLLNTYRYFFVQVKAFFVYDSKGKVLSICLSYAYTADSHRVEILNIILYIVFGQMTTVGQSLHGM